MRVFSLGAGRRRTALGRIADGVLESPDLASLTRLLTRDLPRALEATGASLLLWDRRLESFEGLALDDAGRLVTVSPEATDPARPGARWLLSDGHLLETAARDQDGMLVPLLARSGLAGMLVLGAAPRRKRPVEGAEARLVSIIAARAALAVENHAYQKELIASERLAALGTMAGMMVHDLRGPMTLIRGWAETLVGGDVPPSEAAERARIIVEAVDRLERMTAETLDFARGAEKLVLRSVPLGLFLAELAAGIEAELPGLCVDRDFDVPGARRTSLDVDKIRRAVSNVAANAREAMGGEGRLRFSARVVAGGDASPDRLELVLADDGPGVPEEIRDRVFEPFVTLGKKRGTGLGLAVARRFVEDHGGTLELMPAGAAPTRGAAFRFGLLLSPPPPARLPGRPSGDAAPER
jgi:signal transduction histidine kinase